VGLALLVTALAVPLAAARRARLVPGGPAAAGAYVAYLVHAAVDWDWEIPAITIAGLFCGAVLVVAARRARPGRRLSPGLRLTALVATGALAALAFVGYAGNAKMEASATAATRGEVERAAEQARDAKRWAPWSGEPWRLLGVAQLAGGDPAAARASFRAAIDKDPRDWRLWYSLARASDGRERRAALEVATRLNPLSAEVAALRNP